MSTGKGWDVEGGNDGREGTAYSTCQRYLEQAKS